MSVGCRKPNYLADWARTAYRFQVRPVAGFSLSPIPIGRQMVTAWGGVGVGGEGVTVGHPQIHAGNVRYVRMRGYAHI